MESSIFDDIDDKRIAPQEFSLAVFVGVIYIILSYGYVFFDKDTRQISAVISGVFGVILLAFFRKYIKNFNSLNADKWVNLKMGASIAVVLILTYICVNTNTRHIAAKPQQYRNLVVAILYFLNALFDCLISILLGLELMKTKNDPVGLIRQFGKVIAYYMPVPFFVILALMFFAPFRGMYMAENNLLFMTLVISIFTIPDIYVTAIFYKAHKYQKDNSISS